MAKVQMKIDSVRHAMLKDEWVLVLQEAGAERYLPIYLDAYQADVIKQELTGVKLSPEPADYESFLAGTGTAEFMLNSVTIERSPNDTYKARLSLLQGGKNSEIDCSLFQAVAIAFRRGAPILVEEEILDRIGAKEK